MKRILAALAAIVLLIGLLPAVASADREDADKLPFAARHPQAIGIWDAIERAEREQRKAYDADPSQIAEAIYALVAASDTTAPGSLERHGDAFFWDTTDGAACGYDPAFRARLQNTQGSTSERRAAAPLEAVGTDAASFGVAVIQPYYGIDERFTEQYAEEGRSIAQAIGGTCRIIRAEDATIDAVAQALEDCAVVIFDSWGETDYSFGDDCVSYANTSYLCLHTGDGLTNEDQQYVQGRFGRYKHAYYGGRDGDAYLYMVDGTAIANHMTGTAQGSLLWMANGLGMATDGLHAPLRQKGVQTVYGYSQAVSADGDHRFEESFFYAMKQGATVMSAISLMKAECGLWDPAVSATTESQAIGLLAAFPIVVSDEDAYPGQGKVDALQTVRGKGIICDAVFLYGDVNGDGRLGVTDASLLLRRIAQGADFPRDQLLHTDVNADGKVNTQDASELLRRIAELTDRFPCEP